MAALATWTDKAGYLEAVLGDITHAHWMRALEFVTEQGYGKVPQAMQHAGKDGAPLRFTLAIGERDSDG